MNIVYHHTLIYAGNIRHATLRAYARHKSAMPLPLRRLKRRHATALLTLR